MTIVKWTGPLKPPPSWLSLATEVTGPEPPRMARDAFPVACVDTLLSLECPLEGAFEIAANAIVETDWGQQYRAHNYGGVKATKGWAETYKLRTGRAAPWWRAHGNKSSGDSQTVFYRGYVSMADFFTEWLLTFVPRPGSVGPTHRYRKTGAAFWSRSTPWFPLLVAGFYKGAKTAAKPGDTLADHVSLTASARIRWVQCRLGVDVDGKWGRQSRTHCAHWQALHGLPTTGEADAATCAALNAATITVAA